MVSYGAANFFLCLLGFVFVYYQLNRLSREKYRFKLRSIRNNLYDYMLQNGKDFSDPNYRRSRESINSMIQASNWISAPTLICMMVKIDLDERKGRSSYEPMNFGDNKDLRKKVRESFRECQNALYEYIFLSGFTGVFVRIIAYSLMAVILVFSGIKKTSESWSSFLINGWLLNKTGSTIKQEYWSKNSDEYNNSNSPIFSQ